MNWKDFSISNALMAAVMVIGGVFAIQSYFNDQIDEVRDMIPAQVNLQPVLDRMDKFEETLQKLQDSETNKELAVIKVQLKHLEEQLKVKADVDHYHNDTYLRKEEFDAYTSRSPETRGRDGSPK